ncbi:aldo/keto reductase [Nonomuraea polychroma]|uniref:aldo/keto reductase n=1 Tax=Nonomuraea polychroma TaxID=46176 RepID=UPI003D8DEEB3
MNIALGTIHFGTGVDLKDTYAILDRFHEAGGTMLDTADNYPFWVEGCTGDESEQAIGAWMAARGNRDEIFISTKAGARPTVPGDRTLDSAEGLSAPVLARAAEGSLQRLGTDYVDLYWAHIEDRSVPLEETLGAFNELAVQGKVRALGASNVATWRLDRARNVSVARGWMPYTGGWPCCRRWRTSSARPRTRWSTSSHRPPRRPAVPAAAASHRPRPAAHRSGSRHGPRARTASHGETASHDRRGAARGGGRRGSGGPVVCTRRSASRRLGGRRERRA